MSVILEELLLPKFNLWMKSVLHRTHILTKNAWWTLFAVRKFSGRKQLWAELSPSRKSPSGTRVSKGVLCTCPFKIGPLVFMSRPLPIPPPSAPASRWKVCPISSWHNHSRAPWKMDCRFTDGRGWEWWRWRMMMVCVCVCVKGISSTACRFGSLDNRNQ